MSIESEILRIQRNVANAYAAVSEKGGEVPLQPTIANLEAAVRSIQTGVTQEQLDEAMTVKQDKLTGHPGQVVGFNTTGTAQTVQGWSNPNLLDNRYFGDPVNQRGQTVYTNQGYTIDRWSLQSVSNASLTVNDGYITLTATNNDGIRQNFEAGTIIAGATYTSSLLTAEGDLLSASFVATEEITIFQYPNSIWRFAASSKISADGRSCIWSCVTYNHAEAKLINLVAAKLEPGPIQTLARQDADGKWVLNDPPPNKALELAKCQRYYEVASFQAITTKSSDLCVIAPYKVTKRVNPACTLLSMHNAINKISYYDGTNWVDVDAAVPNMDPYDGARYGARVAAQNIPEGYYVAGTIVANSDL